LVASLLVRLRARCFLRRHVRAVLADLLAVLPDGAVAVFAADCRGRKNAEKGW
jgi:hypothetical protein